MHICAIISPSKWHSLPVSHFLLLSSPPSVPALPPILHFLAVLPHAHSLSLFMFTYGAVPSDCLSPRLMRVLIGWRWSLGWGQEGWQWAVPSHCVTAACNQASWMRRRLSRCSLLLRTHKHTHTLAQRHTKNTRTVFHYCGARTRREKWNWGGKRRENKEWKESDAAREAEKEKS